MLNELKLSSDQKEAIKVLKSGNFSIHYHNNGSGSIYKNRFEYDDFMDEEGNDIQQEEVYSFNYDASIGYLPEIVQLLTLALGGNADSA